MNLGSIAKQVLGTVAPTVLTALGGPFGALAAAILHAALGTVGDEKAADAALSAASPDTLAAIKKAEMDLQAKLSELGIQREQLVFQDLASARQMQETTRDPTAARLAWLVIGGFLAFSVAEAVAMTIYPEQVAKIPAAAWSTIGVILGYLANEAKQAAAFYFGSSAGSQQKDDTIATIAKQS